MRSFTRRATVLSLCLVAGALSWGCEARKATEYVAGISTQVTVPRDLKAVRVEVSVGGIQTFYQSYKVYDGKVQLPRSLGAFPTSEGALKTSQPVTYTIVGLTEDYEPGSSNPVFASGETARVGTNSVRILRRSRQPYVPGEILFLPMPLKFSCYDKQCDGDDMTCKGGKCVSALLTDPERLPRFTPDLVDGAGATCFSVDACMGAAFPMGTAFPAIAVDPATCTYAVANSPSAPPSADPALDPFRQQTCTKADDCKSGVCNGGGRCEPLAPGTPWEGVNVEIVYDGGLSREILDQDPDEGFTIPDPTKPQQFRLAEGLCEMVRAKDAQGNPLSPSHRITAVHASGVCRAKSIAQPLCASDQLAAMGLDPDGKSSNPTPGECSATELVPPRSALMVVADNTAGHAAFFDVAELAMLELPLKDPAFDRTDIGLVYTGDTCSAAPTIAPTSSLEARRALLDSFKSYADPSKLAAGQPSFGAALDEAYAALAGLDPATHLRSAVLVLGNRRFDDPTCGNAVEKAAEHAPEIKTYVLQLVKQDRDVKLEDDVLGAGIYDLAKAGAGGVDDYPNPDARGAKKNAKDAIQRIISALATCVYDVESAKAPAEADHLSFTDPVSSAQTSIPFNAGCVSDVTPGTGWGFGPGAPAGKRRVYVCADSCKAYRDAISSASDVALVFNQPAPAVPLFAHKAACATK